MTTRKHHPKTLIESDVALVLEAIEGRPNPLDDPEMAAVSPDRTSLDLWDGDGRPLGEGQLGAHRSRHSFHACIICGQSPCEHCVAEDED